MGGHHPKISPAGQRGAAPAQLAREDLDALIRLAAPGQERPRRTRLLTRIMLAIGGRCLAFGRLRPGWASIDGGNEEFPLFRDTGRSSRSAFACSSAIAAACSAITISRSAHAGTQPGAAAPWSQTTMISTSPA